MNLCRETQTWNHANGRGCDVRWDLPEALRVLSRVDEAQRRPIRPSQLRYDEHNHIGLTQLVATNRWRDALLSPENRSAAGPLYPAIHLMLSPITHLQSPSIRWVNFCCFLGVVLLLARCKPVEPVAPRLLSGFTLLAVPFLWPAVGMALTELPALLFFTCFVLLFLRLIDSPQYPCGGNAAGALFFAAGFAKM